METSNRIQSIISNATASNSRPLNWRAGPANRASGAHTATRAEAEAAAKDHNAFRAQMIARGAMTEAAPRWIVAPVKRNA